MNKLGQFTFALLTAAFVGLGHSRAAESSPDGSASLAKAIAGFNASASENPIGAEQPPLTEDEVIAAIRWWDFHRKDAPMSDQEYRALRNIAESHQLPPGAEFEVLTGFEPNDEITFDAWSVRIRMPRPNGGTYAFVIRERMIRSRLIGAEERKVIQKWSKSPMGSFQRLEYRREREAAAALDRSNQK
jgi:hypothetical protein